MNRPLADQPTDLWLADGSLRDVYVFDTELDDWEALIVLAQTYPHEYTRDGVSHPLPNVQTVLQDREHSHLLSMKVGKVAINCHFFIPEEIELDIDPRQIAGPEEHSAVLLFVEKLSDAVGKEVVVTAEGSPEATLLRYEHSNHLWHVYEPRSRNDA